MMKRFVGRAFGAAAILAAAAILPAEVATGTVGHTETEGLVADSPFGITGKIVTDSELRLFGSDASDGDHTFYFLALGETSEECRVVAVAADTVSGKPQVLGTATIGFNGSYTQLDWDDGELFVAGLYGVASIPANPGLGSPTIYPSVIHNGLPIDWNAAKQRLLLSSGSTLRCFDRTNGDLVERGSALLQANGLVFDRATDTIVVASNTGLATYQWRDGATAPIAGGMLSYPGGVDGVWQVDGTTLVASISSQVRTFRLEPFPAPPTLLHTSTELNLNGWSVTVGGGGLAWGNLRWGNTDESGAFALRHSCSPLLGHPDAFEFETPRVAIAARNIGAPFSFEATFEQVDMTPAWGTGFAQGVCIPQINGNQNLYGVSMNALKAGASVRVAVYTGPISWTMPLGTSLTHGPFTLRWQSQLTTVTSPGKQLLRIPEGVSYNRDTEKFVVLCWADQPGVIAQAPVSPDYGYESFWLPVTDGAMPASIPWGTELVQSGGPVLALETEEPVDVQLSHLGELLRDGTRVLNATTGPRLSLFTYGIFNKIEIAEDREFTNPVEVDNSADIFYEIQNFHPGVIPVYVRYSGVLQEPVVREFPIQVVTEGPAMAAPTDSGNRHIRFTEGYYPPIQWTTPEDPSGISRYECEVEIDRGDYVETFTRSFSGSETSTGLDVYPHGVMRVRMRATNGFQLVGPWSDWSDGITLYWGDAPQLWDVAPPSQIVGTGKAMFNEYGQTFDPAVLQIAENADFSGATEIPWRANGFETTYQPDTSTQGLRTVYHRLKTDLAVSAVKTTEVFVDTVPPGTAPPVPESNYAPMGVARVGWRIPADPAPSSGGVHGTFQVLRNDGPTTGTLLDEGLWTVSDTANTTLTMTLTPGVPGGHFRARVQASDAAANTSPWQLSESFEVNARPTAPTVQIDPPAPTSGDFITANATGAFDPDGDTLGAAQHRFVRVSPAGNVAVEGNILAPSQVKRNEVWRAISHSDDNRGGIGYEGDKQFSIANGKPTRPFVEIRPRVPQAGQEMIVYVITDSVDPDGDDIGYDFRWYLSRDGGTTWTRKTELNGSPQVSGLYVGEGELWRVEYVPYEVPTTKSAKAVEGEAAWDVVRVGSDNTPPTLTALQPFGEPAGAGATHVAVQWRVTDAQGGPVAVDVYLMQVGGSGLVQLQTNVPGSAGRFEFDRQLKPGATYAVHLVARDNRGAVTQLTTAPIATELVHAVGWMLE